MCWVVGLDCFTIDCIYSLHIYISYPLLIYIQILVSAIHTINDNVNNRSFIQAGFEPAIYSYLFYAFTVHRSTNWAIDRLSFCMLRSKDIYIPLLIESRATSCHAIAAMLRLWETLLPLGNSYPIQHALTYFPNDPTPTICSPMHTITHHLIENKNKESNQIPKQKKTKKNISVL